MTAIVKTLSKVKVIVGLLLVVAILQACGGEKDTADSSAAAGENGAATDIPSVLNVGYIGTSELNLPAGALGWGIEKGIIQEELGKYGITEINLTAFPNGPDLNESLISGRLDLGNLGDTPAILAKSSGANTKLIAQTSTHSIGYLIGKKGGPKTLKDLEGKTIAIQKGSFMHRYISGLLKKEGVQANLIHMLIADAEAALARGEIDALTNSGVKALKLIDEGYTHIDDAQNHPELIGTGVTVVAGDYVEKSPEIATIWNEALQKAVADLKQHEEEYYELVAKISNATPELVKQTSPIEWIEVEPFTDNGLQLLEGTKNFLVEEKLAQKDFEIDEWIQQ